MLDRISPCANPNLLHEKPDVILIHKLEQTDLRISSYAQLGLRLEDSGSTVSLHSTVVAIAVADTARTHWERSLPCYAAYNAKDKTTDVVMIHMVLSTVGELR